MASLVAEVLQPKEPLEKSSLKTVISKLSRKISCLKVDVQKELVATYDTFQLYFNDSERFGNCLETALQEVESTFKTIEEHVKPRLAQSTSEFETLSRELEAIEAQSVEVKKYARLHDLLEQFNAEFNADNFLMCVQLLEDVSAVAAELEGGSEVKLIDVVHTEHVLRSERLIYKLSETWKSYVVWKIGKTPHVTELDIMTVKQENVTEFVGLVKALERLGQLREKMSKFGRCLLTDLVTPMVRYESIITSDPGSPIFRVDFDESRLPSICSVLQNLSNLFSFLDHSFPSPEALGGVNLFQVLGNAVGEEFSDIIVKSCLEPAVPSESSRLGSFPSDILMNLYNQLVHANFLPSGTSPFSSFTSSLESLCINKRSQSILVKARAMMEGELHVTCVVGEAGVSEKKQKLASFEHGLNGSVFAFPKCQVSKFMEELVALLGATLEETAKDGGEGFSSQTWNVVTVRYMCELYCGVVPVFHQHAIEAIPLQTAIHHNNCMYLAHELLSLCSQTNGVTMVDLASKIRRLGTVPFLDQMKIQRQHLLDFLREASVCEGSDGLDNALHRCLFHLQNLKKVWCNVLPVSVYLKAIGMLLNSVLEHVIGIIVGMEDISSTLSEDMAMVLDKVASQVVDVFDVPESFIDARAAVSNNVRMWKKFCELKSLLKFGLREVVDRWADGKGPLAACFNPDELKRLIRALFQNTDRRAAALAKIH